MATVVPFRGVRYNPQRIEDMAVVVTPPYDVIDNAAQRKYYAKSPYNVIRLELGYQFPTDTETDNRYTRAARDYHLWLQNGVLLQENREAIYLCEQEFTVGNTVYRRTGFFARVQLEEYQAGKILPHEETLVKPKADRLSLMKACTANFSPVFAFYVDPSRALDTEFSLVKEAKTPDLALTDETGEKHRIWVLTDPVLHLRIKDALAYQSLYIADGHHRYETALEFNRLTGGKYPGNGYILMYLVNACDPGMVILPTHRIVHDLPGFNLSLFQKQLEKDFAVERIPRSSLIEVLKEQQCQGKISFVMGTQEPATYLLILRDNSRVQALCPGKSRAWCGLDVAVLQVLVFQKLLGLSADQIARQEFISYTRDEVATLETIENRKGQLAFLLNPTRINQIMDVALAGEKMPQKSTYFYPKLLTGLVINDLRI